MDTAYVSFVISNIPTTFEREITKIKTKVDDFVNFFQIYRKKNKSPRVISQGLIT